MKNLNYLFVIMLMALMLISSAASAATITSTAAGGMWKDESTWVGGAIPTENDDVIITSKVTLIGGSYSAKNFYARNLTINNGGSIIREEGGGLTTLIIGNDFVNNGEVIDLADWFDIRISGNFTNNGVFRPRHTTLFGSNVQISSSTIIEGKTFSFNIEDAVATAKSDLHFHNAKVDAAKEKMLNMGDYDLYLTADTITYDSYYGKVGSKSNFSVPIKFDGEGVIDLMNSILVGEITGDVRLRSSDYGFLSNMNVHGDLTIDENTKMSFFDESLKINVTGDFYNFSDFGNDTVKTMDIEFTPRVGSITVKGDVYNAGDLGIIRVYIVTDGKERKLEGNIQSLLQVKQSESNEMSGGKLVIDSKVDIGVKLELHADFEIAESGNLILSNTGWGPFWKKDDVDLINHGELNRIHYVNNSWNYRDFKDQPGTFVDYGLRKWEGELNTINVKTVNAEYPGLPGTAKRWWRIGTEDEITDFAYTIKFYYDESMLNGQNEQDLKVFRSTDEGKSWHVISLGEYVEHNMDENFISIGNWSIKESLLTQFGDFVISDGSGNVPLASPIHVNLIGRNDVRLGAPNRFTVTVDNITNEQIGSFIVAIDISDEIVFEGVEIKTNSGIEKIPYDSIGMKKDNTALFFVPAMDANERIAFDMILKGVPPGTKQMLPAGQYISVGGLGIFVANDATEDYVADLVNKFAGLNDKEAAEYARGLGLAVQQIKIKKEKEGKGVYAFKTVVKYGVENAAKTNPVTNLIYKVGSAIETVAKVAPTLRQRLFHWLYKEAGLYGVDEIKTADGKTKEVDIVASHDPNEKSGPAGYGEMNYLSERGTMTYTISFENLKEATAPAYKIEIVDELSAAYNWETVKFGPTSHSSDEYSWTMERTGNKLRWYIEGIELPPNQTPPEGEGFVQFSVELADNINDGAKIENKASIVFDENPAIITNTWVNVIDTTAPATNSLTAEYKADDEEIELIIDAADNEGGSGLGEISYFVSIDSTPFAFIGTSFDKTVRFEANEEKGIIYRFYAVATDNVGNQEYMAPEIIEIDITDLSSVKSLSFAGKANIYPNPVNESINLDISSETSTPISYRITNLIGDIFLEGQLAGVTVGENQRTFDVSSLSAGVYILRLQQGNRISNYKIVKN